MAYFLFFFRFFNYFGFWVFLSLLNFFTIWPKFGTFFRVFFMWGIWKCKNFIQIRKKTHEDTTFSKFIKWKYFYLFLSLMNFFQNYMKFFIGQISLWPPMVWVMCDTLPRVHYEHNVYGQIFITYTVKKNKNPFYP